MKNSDQTSKVLIYIETHWKGGEAEMPDLRIRATKEVAKLFTSRRRDSGKHIHHKTVHRALKECFWPHLSIKEFDDLALQAIPIIRKKRATNPNEDEIELRTLREVWYMKFGTNRSGGG